MGGGVDGGGLKGGWWGGGIEGQKLPLFPPFFGLGVGGVFSGLRKGGVGLFGIEMQAGAVAVVTPSLSPFSSSPWTCKAACVVPSGFYNFSLFGQSESFVEFFSNEDL
jgi:hypothetical protein